MIGLHRSIVSGAPLNTRYSIPSASILIKAQLAKFSESILIAGSFISFGSNADVIVPGPFNSGESAWSNEALA